MKKNKHANIEKTRAGYRDYEQNDGNTKTDFDPFSRRKTQPTLLWSAEVPKVALDQKTEMEKIKIKPEIHDIKIPITPPPDGKSLIKAHDFDIEIEIKESVVNGNGNGSGAASANTVPEPILPKIVAATATVATAAPIKKEQKVEPKPTTEENTNDKPKLSVNDYFRRRKL